MLGADFSEGAIVEIMNEASKDSMGITYADFLAQWNEREDTMHDQMIREVTVLRDNHNRNVSVDQISEISFDESDSSESGDIAARVSFIERKALSERKASESSAPEAKSPRRESTRRVMFQDAVEPIKEAPEAH